MDTKPILRYHLRENDQIFFLHIPKTGGTTFMNILEKQVGSYRYLSADQSAMTALNSHYLNEFKIVRGHFSYSVYKHFTRRPVFLTILRDPIDRFISNYRHLVRKLKISETISLEDYTVDDKLNRGSHNKQVARICGGSSQRLGLELPVMLEIAKLRLNEFAFVGVLDRFDEGIQLLTYTLGWDPIAEYETLNQAPRNTKKPDIDGELLALLRERNKYDIALFEYANQLFDARYRQMREERGLQ
jgi:hypothetical protein